MTRSVFTLGAALAFLGCAVFAWKVFWYEMPVRPERAENLWRVELSMSVRGSGERGSVTAFLPISDAGQSLGDERAQSDRFLFNVRNQGGGRVGVWRGQVSGMRSISYSFRVQLHPVPEREAGASTRAGASQVRGSTDPERGLPVDAPEIQEILARLDIDAQQDAPARMRTIFAYVANEIASIPIGSGDALLTLASREGSPSGKARLLVTMLRAADVPARVAAGLRLSAPRAERNLAFAEAQIDGRWVPLFPSTGELGTLPRDLLRMRTDGLDLIELTGFEAFDHRYRVTREELQSDELAALMAPANPILSTLSLYRLPVSSQSALRVMLAIPFAALLVAVYRNIVGLRPFGTFLPILVALALRGTGLLVGAFMVAAVLSVGIAGRLILDRFHLLFVPRLCILLCLVIIVLVAQALLGYGFGNADLLTGVLFPIVILTMLIERFSVTVAEEGSPEALLRLLNTTILALCCYPVFQTGTVGQLFFGFPELILVVMGVLVWIGGYTGYRISEIVRFRALAALTREMDL